MAWLNFEQYPQGSRLNAYIDQIRVPCKANLQSTLSLAFPNINKLVSPKFAIKWAQQPKQTPLFNYSDQPVHLFRSRYCNAKHSIHFTSTNEYLPFFPNENDCLVTLAERKRYNFCPNEHVRPLQTTPLNVSKCLCRLVHHKKRTFSQEQSPCFPQAQNLSRQLRQLIV